MSFEKILEDVKNSAILTDEQKNVITIRLDSGFQAAHNAATGEGQGLKFIQPSLGSGDNGINPSGVPDFWELYYNEMMQAICLASHFDIM